MKILGRPSLRPIDRIRHQLWAKNLLAMAKAAEEEKRVPPAPLRAKKFRANPLWLERAMRADSTGRLLPSADRPQSFVGVLTYGADPTQCYQRVRPRLILREDQTSDPTPHPIRRGPVKGRLYDRATFNLVDLGEALLPGSRNILDADLWNLLQDAPRPLYDTHLAVEKLLLQLGLVRINHAQVNAIGDKRLNQLQGPLAPANYVSQLSQLPDIYPKLDFDVLSLLANLVHEAYLMGNRELHEIHLRAFVSHYRKISALKADPSISRDLGFYIEQKIIHQDWWHAGYRRRFAPIDTLQILLAKADWGTLKEERPGLAQTTGWLEIRLDP